MDQDKRRTRGPSKRTEANTPASAPDPISTRLQAANALSPNATPRSARRSAPKPTDPALTRSSTDPTATRIQAEEVATSGSPTATPAAHRHGSISSSALGPALTALSKHGANGPGPALSVQPRALPLTKAASRRGSIAGVSRNASAAPSVVGTPTGSISNLSTTGKSGSGGGKTPGGLAMSPYTSLPSIGGGGSGSAGDGTPSARSMRARGLWNLIRTFVSRKFFSSFMSGAANSSSKDFFRTMQYLWRQLLEQQRRPILRPRRRGGATMDLASSLANNTDLDGDLDDFLAYFDPDSSSDSDRSSPTSELEDLEWDPNASLSASGTRRGSARIGRRPPGGDVLEGMSLDALSRRDALDLASTLAVILRALVPYGALGSAPAPAVAPPPSPAALDAPAADSAAAGTGTPLLSRAATAAHTLATTSPDTQAAQDLFFAQSHQLTAWRILILTLRMRDPVHRRLGLDVIGLLGAAFPRTCVDTESREALATALLNVVAGDEVALLRRQAVQVLGDLFGLYLCVHEGSTPGRTSERVFNTLVGILFSILCRERIALNRTGASSSTEPKPGGDGLPAKMHVEAVLCKMHLFQALGKFLRSDAEHVIFKNMVLYLAWTELEHVTPAYVHAYGDAYYAVLEVVIGILTTIHPTEANRTAMGAMFKKHVQPLMVQGNATIPKTPTTPRATATDPTTALKRLAVQFAALWLPVTHDGAHSTACAVLLDGLKHVNATANHPLANFDRAMLITTMRDADARAAARARSLWHMLQMPGTSMRLQRVPGARRGWFGTPDPVDADDASTAATVTGSNSPVAIGGGSGNMPFTASIALFLPDSGLAADASLSSSSRHGAGEAQPLHPDTVVYVYRPLPSLPGVPANATTVPPVFMDPSWVGKALATSTPYEAQERQGHVPGLPAGFTYAPAPIANTAAAKTGGTMPPSPLVDGAVPQGKSLIPPRPPDGRAAGNVPAEMQLGPRRVPFGFLARPPNAELGAPSAPVAANAAAAAAAQGSGTSDATVAPVNGTAVAQIISAAAQWSGADKDKARFEGDDPTGATGGGAAIDDDVTDRALVEPGCTTERIPLVYAHANATYKNLFSVADGTPLADRMPESEFLVHAPVILDVVEPHRIRRVTARIMSIDKCFEPVAVHHLGYLSPGARFNIHVRKRRNMRPRTGSTAGLDANLAAMGAVRRSHVAIASADVSSSRLSSQDPIAAHAQAMMGGGRRLSSADPVGASRASGIVGDDEGDNEWMTVQLQVEEETSNPFNLLRAWHNGQVATSATSAGQTADGTLFYAPPANVSPMPVGYTSTGEPYYAAPQSLKPIPAGILPNGTRYYHTGPLAVSGWDSTVPGTHTLAGFDFHGKPIFLPRGCKIPTPSGYTRMGVPYYDLSTILIERGILVQDLDSQLTPDVPGKVTEALRSPTSPAWSRITSYIQSVDDSKNVFRSASFDGVTQIWWPANPARGRNMNLLDQSLQFIRDYEDFGHLKAPSIKTVLEPPALAFQSVTGVVTRPCILKFRALRGDYDERDYFFTVEPMEIFSVDVFHVRLQGEGIVQVRVSCHPAKMKFMQVEGALALIDATGRRLVTCKLSALRKSFVKVSPLNVHCGWVLPNQLSTFAVTCENVSTSLVHLQFQRPTNSFYMVDDGIKLQSHESKTVNISFEPTVVGAYESKFLIEAPGGEIITIHLAGVCGVPLAIHPESRADSALGPDVLARERSAFVSRVFKIMANGESVLGVAERHVKDRSEQNLFSSLLYAMDPIGRRRNHITVEFGIVDASTMLPQQGDLRSTASLCLTLFNVSTEALTCSLHSTSPALKFDSLVRVAPHKANTIQLDLTVKTPGEFQAMITLTCPGFTSVPCLVKAFVGCPAIIHSLPTAWMPPVFPGYGTRVTLPVVNMLDAAVEATVELTSSSSRFSCVPTGTTTADVMSLSHRRPRMVPTGPGEKSTLRLHLPPHAVVTFDVHFENVDTTVEFASVQLVVAGQRSPSVTVICMPLWDALVIQDLEALTHWMEQSSINAPLPPVLSPPPLINNSPRMVPPPTMTLKARIPAPKLVSQQPITLYNPSPNVSTLHLLLAPGFALAKQASHVVRVNAGDTIHVHVAFQTEHIAENHAFLIAYPDQAVPIAMPLVTCPLLAVFPPPSPVTREVLLDFGTIESGSAKTSAWCIRSALLCNTRDQPVLWTCRLLATKGRHVPFEVLVSAGELKGMATDRIAFAAVPTVQGTFDATCEVIAKEHLTAPPVVVCQVVLRAHVVLTQVLGLPEAYDFGSCVVGSVQEARITLENIGNVVAKVAFLARPPFDVTPNSFSLQIGAQQQVLIQYSPTESSKDSLNKVACFINHKVAMLRVLGKSGFVELVSNNHHNLLDFGSVSSTYIAWMNVYLTNRGTLPLRLDHIISSNPQILALELVSKQLVVHTSTLRHQRDGWSLIKSKIKALALIGHFLRHKLKSVAVVHGAAGQTSTERAVTRTTTRLAISRSDTVHLSDLVTDPDDLVLEPMHSFALRVGFSTVHQTRQTTDLNFHYSPLVSNGAAHLRKVLKFTVTGFIYRVVEFYPKGIDFGLTPVSFASTSLQHLFSSSSDTSESARMARSGCHQLRISNLSIETQTVSLMLAASNVPSSVASQLGSSTGTFDSHAMSRSVRPPSASVTNNTVGGGSGSMHSAFRIDGRNWTLGPGESVRIPIRFLPAQPQMQYRGEALFQHSHGVTIIRFSGTGASAEVTHGTRVHFGAVSIHREGRVRFQVVNKGLLDTPIHFQMKEAGTFRFDSADPYDLEEHLDAGSVLDLSLLCYCSQQVPSITSSMRVNWKRAPGEPWESQDVHLTVDVGYPMFAVDQMELDFGVTYTKKVLEIRIRNDGNANCAWEIKAAPILTFAATKGLLLPQSHQIVHVTFQPHSFDSLETNIDFVTDAGTKTILAYGIVGVPYLHIPEEFTLVDFGIVEVNETHEQMIVMANTGTKQIDMSMSLEQDDPVFAIEPEQAFIDPGAELTVKVTASPQAFARVYSCQWVVRTTDGERYDGGFSCVGGKAIVVMSKLFDTGSRPNTVPRVFSAGSRLPLTPSHLELQPTVPPRHFASQALLAVQRHVETLKDVTAQLSSPEAHQLEQEIRHLDELRQAQSKASLSSRPTTTSVSNNMGGIGTPVSATRPSTRGAAGGGASRPYTQSGATSPLPPISPRPAGIRSPRPTSVSTAKLRFMEGSLFNLQDVRVPIEQLFAKSEGIMKRLEWTADGGYAAGTGSRVMLQVPASDRLSDSDPSSLDSLSDELGASPAKPKARFKGVTPAADTIDAAVAKAITPEEIQRHIEESKAAIELLQQHIPHLNDSKNVHILETAVGQLMESTKVLEQIIYVPEEDEGAVATDSQDAGPRISKVFELGLLKGNDVLEDFIIFDLPNLGNMPFPFTIAVQPASMTSFFRIKPEAGVIQPGGSVPLLVTFKAADAGEYRAECSILYKGQPQLRFMVTAKVGNPKIEVQALNLNFGLVVKGSSVTLPFRISNSGTYRDTIEFALDSSAFSLDFPERNVRLHPGTDVVLPVRFSPVNDDAYQTKWMIFPASRAAFSVVLEGVGAAPVVRVTPAKLMFGQVFVASPKAMTVQISNSGNWIASLLPRLTHPNFTMIANEKPVQPGDFLEVEPKATLNLSVVFAADHQVDATAQLVVEESMTLQRNTVQLAGYAGAFDVAADGELNYGNLKVEDLASRDMAVRNRGDFSVQVQLALDPPELRETFTVMNGTQLVWSAAAAGSTLDLAPGAAVTLTVNTCPKSSMTVAGNLTVLASSTIDGVRKEKSSIFPFSYFAFDNPIVVDKRDPVLDIGVWAVGKAHSMPLSITNFDNRDAIIRARLEPVEVPGAAKDGKGDAKPGATKGAAATKKKKKDDDKGKAGAAGAGLDGSAAWQTCWSLPTKEIPLRKSQTDALVIDFMASDLPEMSQEAWLKLEYSMDGGVTYAPLHVYHVKGKSGRPNVVLVTPMVDFNYVPCGTSETRYLELRNDGTANAEWIIENGWSNDDVFFLAADALRQGLLRPGESASVPVQFNAAVTFEFSSEMTIITEPEKLRAALHGQGCIYRIYTAGLPKEISLTADINGDLIKSTLTICNDCVFSVPIDLTVEDPHHGPYQHNLAANPSSIVLLGNATTEVLSADRARLDVDIELAPIQATEPAALASLIRDGLQYFVHLRSSAFRDVTTIPVRVHFPVRPVTCNLPDIQFSDCMYDIGKSVVLTLSHQNRFAIPLAVRSTHELVVVQESIPTDLKPHSKTELTVTLHPRVYERDEDIPTSLAVSGALELALGGLLPAIEIPVSGRLVDLQDPPTFEDMDFGPVFLTTSQERVISFKNWGRRPLEYQVMLPEHPPAAFILDASKLKGHLAARAPCTIPITFQPTAVATVTMPVSLVTTLGAFSFDVYAQGILPTVEVAPHELDFGTVGAGFAEMRAITLYNTSPLPVRVTCAVRPIGEDAASVILFTVTPPTLLLEADEKRAVNVMFDAQEPGMAGRAMLTVTALDDQVLGTCRMQGRTGTLAVTCAAAGSTIKFPALEAMEVRRSVVEVANPGEIPVLVAFGDDQLQPVPAGRELEGNTKCVSFGCKPHSVTIPPGGTAKFTLSATGMREGQDSRALRLITPQLVKPIVFEFMAEAKVTRTQDLRNLQQFAKADSSIEDKLSIEYEERPKFKSDEGIWKALLPIVKINRHAVGLGNNHPRIAFVEPGTHRPSVANLLTRPAAIPAANLPKKTGGAGAAFVKRPPVTHVRGPAAPSAVPRIPPEVAAAHAARERDRRAALAQIAPVERIVQPQGSKRDRYK
ncbi:hypothetical protein GGF31_006721 [Allomyces arbusculus]|nr:hypothetical protein GGF31_006721 [Allomyces arbusculus]